MDPRLAKMIEQQLKMSGIQTGDASNGQQTQFSHQQQFADDSQWSAERCDALAAWSLGQGPHPDQPQGWHSVDDGGIPLPSYLGNDPHITDAREAELVAEELELMGRRGGVGSQQQFSDLSGEDLEVEMQLRCLGLG